MWSPTHVQVLVRRAKGLNVKGKNGTNDAFVTIGLGKEKFQTSVKEKTETPDWSEQCELSIPQYGNRSEILLKVLHRNFMGGDEFLGQLSLPLQDFDVYEKPKARWYSLTCKPGQNKTGYRGELEVKIGFTVRAHDTASVSGSVSELNKKARGSISSLNKVAGNIGGSLLSLGGKEKKNLARLASAVSGKVEKVGHKAKKTVSSLKINKEKDKTLAPVSEWGFGGGGLGRVKNLDPGVESEEEEEEEDDLLETVHHDLMIPHPRRDILHSRRLRDDFQFDALSHGSSQGSVQLGMGTVSAVQTPQGSCDNMDSLDLLTDSLRGRAGEESGRSVVEEKEGEEDQISLASLQSRSSQVTAQHSWTPGARPDTRPESVSSQSSLPTYSQAMAGTGGNKKKIIPVQSDSSESAPSSPSSPTESPQPPSLSLSARFRMSQHPQHHQEHHQEQSSQSLQPPQTLGQKLKNSYSFRERKEPINVSNRSAKQSGHRAGGRGGGGGGEGGGGDGGRKHSVESEISFRSNSSSSQGPPEGTRVVLGRETSPETTGARISLELQNQFSGQTREDLIEMLVRLQSTVETQGKKVADLEDYIDGLLIRVMETAPVLLEKNIIFTKNVKKD